MSQGADVYGYFNNHYHGYAPENCLDVLEILGISAMLAGFIETSRLEKAREIKEIEIGNSASIQEERVLINEINEY